MNFRSRQSPNGTTSKPSMLQLRTGLEPIPQGPEFSIRNTPADGSSAPRNELFSTHRNRHSPKCTLPENPATNVPEDPIRREATGIAQKLAHQKYGKIEKCQKDDSNGKAPKKISLNLQGLVSEVTHYSTHKFQSFNFCDFFVLAMFETCQEQNGTNPQLPVVDTAAGR